MNIIKRLVERIRFYVKWHRVVQKTRKMRIRPYKPLPTSLTDEWLVNHMNYNGDDQPCPPPPKGDSNGR